MVQTKQYKAWTLVYVFINGNKIGYPRVVMEKKKQQCFCRGKEREETDTIQRQCAGKNEEAGGTIQ